MTTRVSSTRREWENLRNEHRAIKAERERATQAGDTERLRQLEQQEREVLERFDALASSLRPRWPSERGS